jgi:hypothetical protein
MVEPIPFRRGPDRRRQSRGGRRTGDLDGFAPLVLIVGEDATVVEQAEAILAKLRFAVSTATEPDQALKIIDDLRPNLVVVSGRHEPLIRAATHVPVVVMPDALETLIDGIRRALRVTPFPAPVSPQIR